MEPEIKKASQADIDLYAMLALQKNEIEKSLDRLRPSIEALGVGSHAGFKHALTLKEVVTWKLSVPIAKSLMTPAQIAEATVKTDSLRITVDH